MPPPSPSPSVAQATIAHEAAREARLTRPPRAARRSCRAGAEARPAWCRSRRSRPRAPARGRSLIAWAVSAMIGMPLVAGSALSCRGRLPAVQDRQAHVHQDQVRRLAPGQLQRPRRRPRRPPPRGPAAGAAATACPGSSRCPRPAGSSPSSPLRRVPSGRRSALVRRSRLSARSTERARTSARTSASSCLASAGPLLEHLLHPAVEPQPLLRRQVLGRDHQDRDGRARPARPAAARRSRSRPAPASSGRAGSGRAARPPPAPARSARWRPRRPSSPRARAIRRSISRVAGSSSTTSARRRARPSRSVLADARPAGGRGRSAWSGSRPPQRVAEVAVVEDREHDRPGCRPWPGRP